MVTANLDQFLYSLMQTKQNTDEDIKVNPKNQNFKLFKLYLSNLEGKRHHYKVDTFTILYVVKGNLEIKSEEKSLDLRVGNVLILTADCEYEIDKVAANSILAKLSFQADFSYQKFLHVFANNDTKELKLINQIISSLQQEHVLWLKNNQVARPSQLMQHIIDGYLNDQPFMLALIKAELIIMFILSIRAHSIVTPASLDKTKFDEIVLNNYIEHHFADITLTQTAKYFGFNPNYFSNMVKQKTGKSFVDHVDKRRMQEARILLAQPNISLKKIITLVGYSSKSFFYKKFNEYYNETPAAMRTRLFREANINLK